MDQTEQRFQSFLTRIRPHRVAVFANSEDRHWYQNCLGIIEFLTKLWGGSHCVIIPTDGKSISEEFWAILSSHDPDIFYRYQPTGADQKARDPEEFEELVAGEVRKWASQNGLQEDQARGQVEKAILEAEFDEWTISDELRKQLLLRLAPFHFEKQPLHGVPHRQLHVYAISKGSNPHHPLTALQDVLRAGNTSAKVTQIGVNDATDSAFAPPRLWFAATIGCGDDEYFRSLAEQQVTPVWTPVDENNVNQMIRAAIRPWKYTVDSFPLGLTSSALTSVRTGVARRFELPTIVVVGTSIKDFCLYFNLYWQQGRALWLPPWFMPEDGKFPDRLITAMREAEEAGRIEHNEHFVFVSYSEPKSELAKLKKTIRSLIHSANVDVLPITTEMIERQVQHPSRVYTDGDIGNITTHMLLDNSLPGWFESPVPRTLNPASPMSHRWIVEITFMKHLVPRHPVLGRNIISGSNVGDVRSGGEGASYMCPGAGVFGDHMETNILRPSIHVPDADEIFRVILDDCGYESKTSDKGRYEAATVQKFGSLENAGFALWSEKRRTLLQKFCDKTASKKDVFDQGVFLKDRRRYLDFQSINAILQSEDLACQVIDEYIQKGIFYRGFIFVCENCSDAAWHSISDVNETFTCRRCGLNQQYKFASWKRPKEPSWFYKLDEMIYLMLEQNGHVPLLTLDKLRIQSKESFLFRPELRLIPKSSTSAFLEIDICCVPNGKLCIGESKSTDDLAGDKMSAFQTAQRYRDLALKMGASMVVFSTSEKAWNQASVEAIRRAFEKYPHIEVLTWTSAALYA